jgi:DNA-binding CsgD family transcriptional regulator
MRIIRTNLPARDWRKIAEITDELRRARSRPEIGAILFAGTEKLIVASGFFFCEVHRGHRGLAPYAVSVNPAFIERLPALNEFIWQHPQVRYGRRHSACGALETADCISPAAWLRLPIYNECFRGLEMEAQLAIMTPQRPDLLALIAFRQRHNFRTRDREIMDVLGWHIDAADTRLRREARNAEKAGGLTRREREVLREAARGLSNAEIGGALFVSAGTVRRHFENIFAKLGVHSRVAALHSFAQADRAKVELRESVDEMKQLHRVRIGVG